MMQGFGFPLRSARGAALGGLCATASHSTTFYDLFKTAAQLPPLLIAPARLEVGDNGGLCVGSDVSTIRGQLVHSPEDDGHPGQPQIAGAFAPPVTEADWGSHFAAATKSSLQHGRWTR